MEFKKLDLIHKELFDRYKERAYHVSSVHNFTALYMWREPLGIEVAEEDDVLYLRRVLPPDIGYLPPLASDDKKLVEALDKLKVYSEENNFPKQIIDAEKWLVDRLESIGFEFTYRPDRDNSEYLYDGEKLRTLSGKKMHGKKNHYNNFVKNNIFSIKKIEDAKDAVMEMEKRWLIGKESAYTVGEKEGIKDVLDNMGVLPVKGIAVFINDRCEAFTISEDTGEDSVLVHVEKANDDINGMFTFVNSENIKINHPDAQVVNREQDLGIEGLRKAKESWKPISMVDKFRIDF